MLPDPTPLFTAPVIPVLTIARLEDAVPLAHALVAGGLPVIEVTLRTDCAVAAIRAIAQEVRGAIVGAGTVTEPPHIDQAVAAGARFLVSPGTTAAMAKALARSPVPVTPGCQTVSEALTLADLGFPVLKFFPADAAGGVPWLKSIGAPLPRIKFVPTGGIGPDNAKTYLALPNIVAVGGSWVAPGDALKAGDWARVEALASAASRLRG